MATDSSASVSATEIVRGCPRANLVRAAVTQQSLVLSENKREGRGKGGGETQHYGARHRTGLDPSEGAQQVTCFTLIRGGEIFHSEQRFFVKKPLFALSAHLARMLTGRPQVEVLLSGYSRTTTVHRAAVPR